MDSFLDRRKVIFVMFVLCILSSVVIYGLIFGATIASPPHLISLALLISLSLDLVLESLVSFCIGGCVGLIKFIMLFPLIDCIHFLFVITGFRISRNSLKWSLILGSTIVLSLFEVWGYYEFSKLSGFGFDQLGS